MKHRIWLKPVVCTECIFTLPYHIAAETSSCPLTGPTCSACKPQLSSALILSYSAAALVLSIHGNSCTQDTVEWVCHMHNTIGIVSTWSHSSLVTGCLLTWVVMNISQTLIIIYILYKPLGGQWHREKKQKCLMWLCCGKCFNGLF